MTEILLTRHGETDWNVGRRVQGHTDIPLNVAGVDQARVLAEQLAGEPLKAVFSSDLSRALDTATAVADMHGLVVTVDPRLREKNFGTWEGLTDVEIGERFPDAQRGQWGDAETTEEVSARVLSVLDSIRELHPTGPVLVVSHGGPLRAALRALSIEHGPIGNCAVFRASY
jgi:broad specificity phosphatase PhoE